MLYSDLLRFDKCMFFLNKHGKTICNLKDDFLILILIFVFVGLTKSQKKKKSIYNQFQIVIFEPWV